MAFVSESYEEAIAEASRASISASTLPFLLTVTLPSSSLYTSRPLTESMLRSMAERRLEAASEAERCSTVL